ncbi:hypothetical protein GCM10018954_002490 [Kutzneria kofuensis]
MRVLVIGSGAREHALLLALSKDPAVTALACAPGNAGTSAVSETYGVDLADPGSVAALAKEWNADLVVIGPEVPLVAGAADPVRDAGIPCFGPSKEAARIEGSKAFAKDVMQAAGVPTARSEIVDTPARLDAALHRFGPTWVVKDDGLAAGKGVVVTKDYDVARAHAMHLLDGGHPVLLESFLDGPEASLFCVVDGATVVPLLPAQDFKRVGDNDAGPNTGGMGAYSPLPWAPAGLVDDVVARVVQPVVDELASRGTPFSGLLYCGLALTSDGPQVIEFNCRFGDPRPRPCWRCSRPLSPASSWPPPRAGSPTTRRSSGRTAPPSPLSSPPRATPAGPAPAMSSPVPSSTASCTPAPVAVTTAPSSPPAAVSSPSSAPAPTSPPPATPPTPSSPASNSPAPTTAPTSPSRPPTARSASRRNRRAPAFVELRHGTHHRW